SLSLPLLISASSSPLSLIFPPTISASSRILLLIFIAIAPFHRLLTASPLLLPPRPILVNELLKVPLPNKALDFVFEMPTILDGMTIVFLETA
ncbi:Unknown protein, partial [Striga hermonthica]